GGVWARPLFDLSSYAGQTVQLAFYFHSDDYRDVFGYGACGSPDVAAGWYLDEVTVVTGPIVPPIVANVPEGFEGTNQWDRWYTTAGTWQIGVPTSGPGGAHAGNNVAATVLFGNYEDWQDSSLVDRKSTGLNSSHDSRSYA